LGVPARYADALARAVLQAGAGFGITPYGLEALNVMRIEKGHVAGGELNGQTTARDLGLAKMMSTKKDYIGRIMAHRPALVDPDRPILVGFKPVDGTSKLAAGAHFIPVGAEANHTNDEGHMTAACFSPVLGHPIGLGLLKRGRERIGQRTRAVDLLRGSDVEVEICDPVFVDPQGERLRV
jgi:methylglutamate dehydrogenase subunit C